MFGSGPGTFSIAYKKLKSPDSEMALLTHNDYLEQASDSGLIGFLGYFWFIMGHLWYLYRKLTLKFGIYFYSPVSWESWVGRSMV